MTSSLPHWGGPEGIDWDGTTTGEEVYTYGNSSLRAGVAVLSPKTGVAVGTEGDGWTHTVYTATPGIPGDSGSPVLSQNGDGLGVLVTVALAPLAGSNGVTDLGRALAYANSHGTSAALVEGTVPFEGGGVLGLLPR